MSNLFDTYNLKKWPVKIAGPCPTDENIHQAHALLMAAKGGRLRYGAAENLAVAAYLRPADVCVNPLHVAKALSACLGVTASNPRNNVVRIILGATARGRETGGGKQYVELTTTPGHITVTKLGQAAIDKYAPQVEPAGEAKPAKAPKVTKPRKAKPVKPAVTAAPALPGANSLGTVTAPPADAA